VSGGENGRHDRRQPPLHGPPTSFAGTVAISVHKEDESSTARRRVGRVINAWGAIERHAAGLLLITMTALYAFNVLVRLVMPSHAGLFAWIDEAARYMMVWVVFLAAGITLEIGRQISVDLVHERMGARARRILFAIIDIVGLVFSLGAAITAAKLVVFVAGTGQISPTLGVPAYILYVAPAVGFASLALRYLLRLSGMRDARRWRESPQWLETAER
jgi:TRAP-type C4-dicarboxylate transport system permease small subunit